jgi:hypothetical protein
MAGRPNKARALGLREQAAYIRQIWPGFSCKVQRAVLISRGCVQPLPSTREYHVRVCYRAGDWPRVFVEAPGLARRADREKVPHTYAENEPCLFYPTYREWSPEMPIALTIIPWLLEWLLYYEAWLATGEWLGGGVHLWDGVLVAESRASSG